MAKAEPYHCTLDAPESEDVFRRFVDSICGEAGHARHAALAVGPEGPRCLLQNSGRCIDTGTPWRMARDTYGPLLRFDDAVEWVALFPLDDWQMRCDAALSASLDGGASWSRLLAEELLAELPLVPHLIIRR
ncbi:hypothetical protein [Magnetospirillum sp. SS-4]|uniref:hypothetical protein n=1 Tax=Magnetospirillum sp. SS-4 TaxID=2681465 RepID=UPI001573085A|nr:hypothetical protein [Magnetospirillum sp. SS-4]